MEVTSAEGDMSDSFIGAGGAGSYVVEGGECTRNRTHATANSETLSCAC